MIPTHADDREWHAWGGWLANLPLGTETISIAEAFQLFDVGMKMREAVIAEEREACARIAGDFADWADEIATAIRARS